MARGHFTSYLVAKGEGGVIFLCSRGGVVGGMGHYYDQLHAASLFHSG